MQDLATRSAPLEYWFWKSTTPTGGVIVDYILRRSQQEAELRVGVWSGGVRAVTHETVRDWSATIDGVRIGECTFGRGGASGASRGASWELDWDLGPARVSPRPDWFGPVHPFDLELLVWPRAQTRGHISIDGLVTDLTGAATVSHYFGRRLPDSWVWISATGFDDDPEARLEAAMLRSTLWGSRAAIPAGYVWTSMGGRDELTVMPLTGYLSSTTDGRSVSLRCSRPNGSRRVITCSAPDVAFNDAGERIRQAVSGRLSIDGRVRADGTVGLEFRDPPARR